MIPLAPSIQHGIACRAFQWALTPRHASLSRVPRAPAPGSCACTATHAHTLIVPVPRRRRATAPDFCIQTPHPQPKAAPRRCSVCWHADGPYAHVYTQLKPHPAQPVCLVLAPGGWLAAPGQQRLSAPSFPVQAAVSVFRGVCLLARLHPAFFANHSTYRPCIYHQVKPLLGTVLGAVPHPLLRSMISGTLPPVTRAPRVPVRAAPRCIGQTPRIRTYQPPTRITQPHNKPPPPTLSFCLCAPPNFADILCTIMP